MDGIQIHVHGERVGWGGRIHFSLLDWLGRLLLSFTHVGGVGKRLEFDAFFFNATHNPVWSIT